MAETHPKTFFGRITLIHPLISEEFVIRWVPMGRTFIMLSLITGELRKFNAETLTTAKLLFFLVENDLYGSFSEIKLKFLPTFAWVLFPFGNMIWIATNNENNKQNNLKVIIFK